MLRHLTHTSHHPAAPVTSRRQRAPARHPAAPVMSCRQSAPVTSRRQRAPVTREKTATTGNQLLAIPATILCLKNAPILKQYSSKL